MSELTGEVELNVDVKLNNMDAITLWTVIRDLVEENKQGWDSGKGGYFPLEDGFKMIRCMERLAIGLDAHRASLTDTPPSGVLA